MLKLVLRQGLNKIMEQIISQWVWKNIDDSLADEIIAFWISEKAISENRAKSRVPEVIMTARDSAGSIIGLTTMKIGYCDILENNFCFWRQYTAKAYRNSRVASSTGLECWKILDEMHKKGRMDAKGIIVEIENKFLSSYLKKAILVPMPFVFFGYTEKGYQNRVCYFTNAKLD